MAHTIQRNVGEWEDFFLGLIGDDAAQLARQAVAKGAIQKVAELAELVKVLRVRKPKVVVEIGSGRGGTFWALCQVAADDAMLVSIDLPGGDYGGSEIDLYDKKGIDRYGSRDEAKLRGHARADQEIHLIRGDSKDSETREHLERILAGRTVDFLLIDGDHTYEGVRADFQNYSGYVDGLIAFHDILDHPEEPRCRVDRFWREIKRQYDVQEFTKPEENWGWGKWGGIGLVHYEGERMAVAA